MIRFLGWMSRRRRPLISRRSSVYIDQFPAYLTQTPRLIYNISASFSARFLFPTMDAVDLARWTRFAAKGGIGKCTAIQDCVAKRAEDLMFLMVCRRFMQIY